MTPERFRQVERIFLTACEQPPTERQAYLDDACGSDSELRSAVEAMIVQDAQTHVFADLGQSGSQIANMLQLVADSTGYVPASDTTALPEHIGAYRVLRCIGEGGMGVVYEAEQQRPRRRVALKVIRASMNRRQILRRFEQEAQVLGSLQHPGIAQIYEAASAPIGNTVQPFLAMEFVPGVPITECVRAQQFGTRAILELFCSLCDAVQYAHQRGVIHRDLKPANILVGTDGQPRILDFGVARVTNADLQVTTQHTDAGQLIGTLQYMSPEQVAADVSRVDTRSDVYALGVLLYELLAGEAPYDVSGCSIPDAALIIREQAPTNLSTINRNLRGDVETIVRKAMDKERDRRYTSAAELATDVRRYLNSEPIIARPPSSIYQLRKFAVRNKALATGTFVACIALLVGTVVASAGLLKAQNQRDAAIAAQQAEQQQREVAEQQAAIAQAVNDFLNDDLLAAVDPGRTADREITMREVVDIAAAKIEGRFAHQPLVEASICVTLANTYDRLGDAGTALPLRTRTAAILEAQRGAGHPDTVAAECSLATTLMELGRFGEAEEILSEKVDILARTQPEDDEVLLHAKTNLASVYLQQGQFAQAAPILEETLKAKRRTLGDRDTSTLTSINNLAGLYFSLDDLEKAVALYREAHEGRREVLGDGDPKALSTTASYAFALSGLRRHDEARAILHPAWTAAQERLGDDHPVTLRISNTLGNIVRQQGDLAEAERLFRKTVRAQTEQLGPNHIIRLHTVANLGSVIQERQKYSEALPLLEEVLEADHDSLPATHWLRGSVMVDQGRCWAALGDFTRGAAALHDAHDLLEDTFGADDRRSITALRELAKLYDAWDAADPGHGYDDEATRLRAGLASQTSVSDQETRPE